ncbi:MAG: GAF domain-containing protein [Chloroflexi bacterium]|nr:GAF domain-containing protein [Chloroflexota bacterium]
MKSLNNLTLGKKITFLTAVGLLLGVGILSFLGMRAVNDSTDTMLRDRQTTARIVADYLDETLGRALTELTRTAGMLDTRQNPDEIDFRIRVLEDRYSLLSIETQGVYLLNREGRVVWSKPTAPGETFGDVVSYSTIIQTLRESKTTVSGLVPAPRTGTPVVLLASPVRVGEMGALVVAVYPSASSIGGFVRPIRLGETGYVEIVDQNGTVVVRTEPGPKLAPFEKSDHSGRFVALIEAGEPTRGLCHTCHEPGQRVMNKDVLGFVPLSQARWGVVIRQSEDEALASIGDLRRGIILFGVGLISVALIFVAVTTRDVVGRIRMLTLASRRMAEGDMASPVDVARGDEVGLLASTFEDMRTKLRDSYLELEQRTKELSSLLSLSDILSALRDLSNQESILGKALDKTLEIMKEDIGGILLLDEGKQTLCYAAHRGLLPEDTQSACYHVGEGLAGRVAETGEAILVGDVLNDPRLVPSDRTHDVDGLKALANVPLLSKDKVLGVLTIGSREVRRFTGDDARLLEVIAGQIATALENAQLQQEVQHKEEMRGVLLREIFSIQEEERRRIARELHDETSQVLASLSASLEAASSLLPDGVQKTRAILKKAQALSIHILDEIHKIIYELRPTLLDDLGLVAAARWLADNNLGEAGIKATFKIVGQERRLPPQLEATVFRVIQEAVYNIARHAQATSATISLQFRKDSLGVRVEDNGVGFDVEKVISSADRPRGLGLLGMRERVELINGTLRILSYPGSGTEIDIEIPLNPEEVLDGQGKQQDKSIDGR